MSRNHSNERLKNRKINRTSSESLVTPRRRKSNLDFGVNVLEMTTVILPHLKYHRSVLNKLSTAELALF
jgi:hypothetical protein